jgi:hypothetical protein
MPSVEALAAEVKHERVLWVVEQIELGDRDARWSTCWRAPANHARLTVCGHEHLGFCSPSSYLSHCWRCLVRNSAESRWGSCCKIFSSHAADDRSQYPQLGTPRCRSHVVFSRCTELLAL